MPKIPVRKFFYGLNIQFIIYFLLFAYVPLLIFSIIGYFLNINVIQRVHEQNLDEVSGLAVARLNDYFDSKERELRKVFLVSKHLKNAESYFIKALLQDNAYPQLLLLKQGRVRYIKNLPDSLIKTLSRLPQNFRLWHEEKSDHFFLFNQLPEGYAIWCGLPKQELARRIYSLNNQVRFEISNKLNGHSVAVNPPGEAKTYRGSESLLLKVLIASPPFIKTEMDLNDNWTLRTIKSKYQVFAALIHFLQQIFIANLIIGLLMLIVAILLSRRLTGPIRDLVEAANRISNGELQRPLQISARDEIKVLAEEFELMRQKLLASYSNLESKIEERTKALREAQFQISHQEKMASLGLLAAGVAHEIGNPLTSISSMAQILMRRSDNPQLEEYLQNILKNIERISKIVRELVDFARPSSYEASLVDVNELIRHAVNIVKYDRRTKHIQLQMDLDKNLPAIFLVADQLLQVFINILINAVDALPQDGGELYVQTYSKNGRLFILFRDNGVGIPEEHIGKIFEPFFTTKKVGKGTGLGLSVSYGIIKNFDGEIHVRSKVMQGSTFTIEIPMGQQEHVHEG